MTNEPQKKIIAHKELSSPGHAAKSFLETILHHLGYKPHVHIQESEERCILQVTDVDPGPLIGRNGMVLDALQFLVGRMVAHATELNCQKRIVIDIGSYRERRSSALVRMARRLGKKVCRTGKPIKIEPLCSFDRRIVHLTLQEIPGIRTQSEGEGPYRRVQILPEKGNFY